MDILVYGIGAGPAVDGQLVISNDALGSFVGDIRPKFVKRYADVGTLVEASLRNYASDVRARRFPAPEHCYPIDAAEEAAIHAARPSTLATAALVDAAPAPVPARRRYRSGDRSRAARRAQRPSLRRGARMSRTVTVGVPASTSNLGAGFDCVGVAVERWINVTARLDDGVRGFAIARRGTLAALTMNAADNRLVAGFRAACRRGRRDLPDGVAFDATSNIPVGRGLGSSASATLAGALAANALLGLGLTEFVRDRLRGGGRPSRQRRSLAVRRRAARARGCGRVTPHRASGMGANRSRSSSRFPTSPSRPRTPAPCSRRPFPTRRRRGRER